ncbi:MAG: cob(I)yrinic acid a,c-diamide adenosyltransferase [Clostridiales bacterium]|nr:cob(I)yrinic acid a,c-diamide adenosyltransferase [Clostridiales bacterium]
MIHIYYGDGKGKTTAALGLGMRAVGAGMKTGMVQYLKDCKSSELKELPFDIWKAPKSLPFSPDKSYRKLIDDSFEFINGKNFDLLILDEFLDIVNWFIDENEAVSLISELKNKCEIVITGHKKIDKIFDMADYIANMKNERHPYDKGIAARKGIEY